MRSHRGSHRDVWQDRFDRLRTREILTWFEVGYFRCPQWVVTSFCSTYVACKERQWPSSPVDVVDEDRDAMCCLRRSPLPLMIWVNCHP
jgi:hypothetical protein